MKLLNLINGEVVETQTVGLECVKDANGVLWHKNSKLDFVVNSKMEVYQVKGEVLVKSKAFKSSSRRCSYGVKLNNVCKTMSLSAIVAHTFNVHKNKHTTLELIDQSKGLQEGNFTFVTYGGKPYREILQPITKSNIESPKFNENVVILKLDDFKSLVPEIQKIEGYKEYQTDDGSIFTSKEIADWHQKNVDKGKNNAEIVVSYGGGYALAEQIYMQEVKYPEGKKPYKDFKVMLSQVGGIRELEKPAKFTISLDESNVKCFTDEREASLFAKKVGAFRFLETTVK